MEDPFVHLLPRYPGPGCGGSCLSRDTQPSLSLDISSSSSGRIQRCSQDSLVKSHSSVSWVFLGVSSWQDIPGTPPKVSRGHLIQMPEPHQLAPLDVEEQLLYSELLLGDRAPHPISKGAPRHPAEETHFGSLYPGSYKFMEELILIPAASHMAANHPRTCWRSWLEGASKTTSSAKSRDEIQRLPSQTPSGPWLLLEIKIHKNNEQNLR